MASQHFELADVWIVPDRLREGSVHCAALLWHQLWHQRERDGDVSWVEQSLLEVFAVRRAGGGILLERIAQQRFDAQAEFEEHNGLDVNGDGVREIALQIWRGGTAWGDGRLELFSLKNDQLTPVVIDTNPFAVPQALEDIDGNGILEVVAINTRWEFGFRSVPLGHACSPAIQELYAWEQGRYVHASPRFSAIM